MRKILAIAATLLVTGSLQAEVFTGEDRNDQFTVHGRLSETDKGTDLLSGTDKGTAQTKGQTFCRGTERNRPDGEFRQ